MKKFDIILYKEYDMKKPLKLFWSILLFPILYFPYKILNALVLVKVFGCGCTNQAFNANDITKIFWIVIGVLTIIFPVINFFKFKNKKHRLFYLLYILLITLYTILMAKLFIQTMMWD